MRFPVVWALLLWCHQCESFALVRASPMKSPVNTFTTITAVFDKPLNQTAAPVITVTELSSGTLITTSVTYGPSNTIRVSVGEIFQYSQYLRPSTMYLISFVGVADLDRHRLDEAWVFTTNSLPPMARVDYNSDHDMFWGGDYVRGCTAAFCDGIPTSDRFAADFPCKAPIFEVAVSSAFRRPPQVLPGRSWVVMYPYGKGDIWPCVDDQNNAIAPAILNFSNIIGPPISGVYPYNQSNASVLTSIYILVASPNATDFKGTVRTSNRTVDGVWTATSLPGNGFQFQSNVPLPPSSSIFLSVSFTTIFGDDVSYAWQFTTYGPLGTAVPPNGARMVAPDANVRFSLTTPVDRAAFQQSFALVSTRGGRVAGSFDWNGDASCTFFPATALALGTAYVVTVNNNELPGFVSAFTTSGEFIPSVVTIVPPNGASDVSRSTTIVITFDTPMNVTSVESGFSLLAVGGGRSTGWFSWSLGNSLFAFSPSSQLPASRSIVVGIAGATDSTGTAMPEFSSLFQTGANLRVGDELLDGDTTAEVVV